MTVKVDRRSMLKSTATFVGLGLAGCDAAGESSNAQAILRSVEPVNRRLHRFLGRRALAAEFTDGDLSPEFRAYGTLDPATPEYQKLTERNFADWRLSVNGLVDKPIELSLTDVRQLPARTQITRHDCVEGWSCVGKWTGARLGTLLNQVKLQPRARYIVFHCADLLPSGGLSAPEPYYESIDLDDAFHEQTILAYEMNDRALPVAHGAPLRLRVERQLGYKHAKYLMGIEIVEAYEKFGGGRGSYWADHGYSWYAGI